MDIFYPLQKIADFLTFSLLGLKENTHLAQSLNFFIYDSIKIFILLSLIIKPRALARGCRIV